MKKVEKDFRNKIMKKAIRMQIGGFRPPKDKYSSFFGKVNFCSNGESWPESNGKPMIALCQINLNELPFRPDGLEDIDFITLFIDSSYFPSDDTDCDNWCLRTYRNTDDLIEMPCIETGSSIIPFPMRPEVIEDYPCWDDLPIDCPEELEEDFYSLFPNQSGFKLGGWPTLLQSEIFWSSNEEFNPTFIFQVDSIEKCNWVLADGGIAYLGRETVKGKLDEWFISWQSY